MTYRLTLLALVALSWCSSPSQAEEPPPPTFPVRFVSKRPGREFSLVVRVRAVASDEPRSVDATCTTPCTLDLPEGPSEVKVQATEGNRKPFVRSILVPPRASVATVEEASSRTWTFWMALIVGVADLAYGIVYDAIAFRCGGACDPFSGGLAVTVTVAGAALGAAGLGQLLTLGRNRIVLRDGSAPTATRQVRFSGLGAGPTSTPGVSLRFSF